VSSIFCQKIFFITLSCKNRFIVITSFASNSQFSLKVKCSTHMSTMVLKETLQYYNSSNSKAFCMFLDATNAFDRVRKLFRLLVDKGSLACRPIIVSVDLSTLTIWYVLN